MTTLVFDISSVLAAGDGRPHGMTRVQLDLAAQLVDQDGLRVEFCRFDRRLRRYVPVSPVEVRDMAIKARSPERRTLARTRPAVRVQSRLLQLPGGTAHAVRAAAHLRRAFLESGRALDTLVQRLANRLRGLATRRPPCLSESWGADTVYCSVGLDWITNDLGYLSAQRQRRGFRVCLFVYDLIPVVRPQFNGHDFTPYFASVVATADVLLTDSQNTKHDLHRFGEHIGRSVPPITVVPMASGLIDVTPEPPTIGPPLRFALSVGTIEIRKNHHRLFDVWERLLAELGSERAPHLVLAGRRGWLNEETLSRLRHTPGFDQCITHLEDASDAELAWLYQHCELTLYPSLYEGWGLPVTESLDAGKVCLASDHAAVREAGEGLAVHLDPFDYVAWHETLLRFWNDHASREALERKILAEHRRVTASDTVAALLGALHFDLPEALGKGHPTQ